MNDSVGHFSHYSMDHGNNTCSLGGGGQFAKLEASVVCVDNRCVLGLAKSENGTDTLPVWTGTNCWLGEDASCQSQCLQCLES